jgi:hypothetical protein
LSPRQAPRERDSWTTTLFEFADTVSKERIAKPAIVIVRLPKAEAANLRAA